MTDIVERLRKFAKTWLSGTHNGEIIYEITRSSVTDSITTNDLTEAADIIEAQREALTTVLDAVDGAYRKYGHRFDEADTAIFQSARDTLLTDKTT